MSFIVDYSLFSIFSVFINNLSVCNILARIISGTLNYIMNRNYVFQSKKSIPKSLIEYILLALFVIIVNTILLNIFVDKLFINKFIAKILVEIILFIISYLVQKKIIFKKEMNN